MMSFCNNCGKQLSDDVKFCPECGASVINAGLKSNRQQTYAGEVRKCPNCGETLSSFEVICHTCGYELHNATASSAVQRLANEIAKVEATRIDYVRDQNSNRRLFGKKEDVSPIDKTIANIIRSFAVPNTKEDILEFLMLAASSIETDVLENNQNASPDEKSRKVVSEAWVTKFEQTYQKAKLTLGKSPNFSEIETLYNNKKKEIRRGRTKTIRQIGLLLIGYIGFMIFILLLVKIL